MRGSRARRARTSRHRRRTFSLVRWNFGPPCTRTLRLAPVVLENRPENLIEVPPVALERSAQNAFLQRADFPQRGVAAAVRRNRPRLEPMHADDAEREVDDGPRTFDEHAAAPERRADGKSPFRAAESGLELPHLEQPHRIVVAVGHDAEAEAVAARPLVMRLGDESLEAFHRARQRRDELRHFFARQHRQQRRRIAVANLSKRDVLAANRGKPEMPVERNRSGLDSQLSW